MVNTWVMIAYDELKLSCVAVDDVETSEVVPGILRRSLCSEAVWVRAYDFAPGTEWPETDHHADDELIYVASGELVDNGLRFPAGSFLHYGPNSQHRPGTETGVRILVFGPLR